MRRADRPFGAEERAREAAGRFNPRAYWEMLSPTQQRAFGEALLLHWIANQQATTAVPDKIYQRWMHASTEAAHRLTGMLPHMAIAFPEGPDLWALEIRACRACGCTEISACEGGCSWVGPELCSACAQGTPTEPPR